MSTRVKSHKYSNTTAKRNYRHNITNSADILYKFTSILKAKDAAN